MKEIGGSFLFRASGTWDNWVKECSLIDLFSHAVSHDSGKDHFLHSLQCIVAGEQSSKHEISFIYVVRNFERHTHTEHPLALSFSTNNVSKSQIPQASNFILFEYPKYSHVQWLKNQGSVDWIAHQVNVVLLYFLQKLECWLSGVQHYQQIERLASSLRTIGSGSWSGPWNQKILQWLLSHLHCIRLDYLLQHQLTNWVVFDFCPLKIKRAGM